MPRKKATTTQEQVDQARELLKQGVKTTEISRRLKMNLTAVYRASMGWNPSGGPKPPTFSPSVARQRGER
jgi:hypothetical protein